MKNEPYVKQFTPDGFLMNPIAKGKEHFSEFANRKQRRAFVRGRKKDCTGKFKKN